MLCKILGACCSLALLAPYPIGECITVCVLVSATSNLDEGLVVRWYRQVTAIMYLGMYINSVN